MNIREYVKLYFIMGSTNCELSPVDTLEQAIQGGVTLFQYREKGEGSLNEAEKIQLALQLRAICKRSSIPFIVNDDLELALLLDADGIHIGQNDLPIEIVREKMGHKIIGLSCHNVQEAKAAIQKGTDYIGVGPMFETITKLDAERVCGPKTIHQIRSANLDIPIVGIGGITVENAHTVIEAGADGVAVISAISRQSLPLEAARRIRKSIC
ncbi:thiamine phosphate synthase [Bacillus sp. BGMRC 2118]|nr:thiamine phosphate synthase [Bacillus sp. BGMRC 2118]